MRFKTIPSSIAVTAQDAPESFTPTPHLRWLSDHPMAMPVLQQQFQGSNGTVRWEDVPVVQEGAE